MFEGTFKHVLTAFYSPGMSAPTLFVVQYCRRKLSEVNVLIGALNGQGRLILFFAFYFTSEKTLEFFI